APLEYAASPLAPSNAAATWPCAFAVGRTCASNQLTVNGAAMSKQKVDFRGFLYVNGDLNVTAGNWLIVGAVRVDGQLTVQTGATLTILYDDEINHNVQTTLFQLQVRNCTDKLGQSPCANWGGTTRCDGSCF